MLANWKTEIVQMVRWKEIIAKHDVLHAYPWHFPKVAASLNEVLKAETAIGMKFSEEFREFLTYANGWRGFFVLVDLFGTEDFINGRATEILKRPEVLKFIQEKGWSLRDVIPIGGSDLEVDVYLHISPDSSVLPGSVLWWAKEEIERYDSFHEFLSEMINYNAGIANKLANKAGGGAETETRTGGADGIRL